MSELVSACECDGETGCSARDCAAKSPAERRERQAAELRAIVRRALLPGGVDPFAPSATLRDGAAAAGDFRGFHHRG